MGLEQLYIHIQKKKSETHPYLASYAKINRNINWNR